MNTLTSKVDTVRRDFFYLEYKVTPKLTLARATGNEAITIELPADRVVDWKHQQPDRYLTDEEIAIELTQGVMFSRKTGRRFL
jgi:hypothetical protein